MSRVTLLSSRGVTQTDDTDDDDDDMLLLVDTQSDEWWHLTCWDVSRAGRHAQLCRHKQTTFEQQRCSWLGHCLSTAFLYVCPHCANARWNRCQQDLNNSPLQNWGYHQDTLVLCGWRLSCKKDLKSNNLSLNEAIDVAQYRPLWRLMSTFDATHS